MGTSSTMGETICTASSAVTAPSRRGKRSRESTNAAGTPRSSVSAVASTATLPLFHRYHGTCVCVRTKR